MYGLVLLPSFRKRYVKLYMFGGKYIYANSKITVKNNSVCYEMANRLITDSIKICSIMIIAICLAVLAPIQKLIFTNEKEMLIPVILPFIDPDTDHGFYINLLNQSVTGVYGGIKYLNM